MIFIFFSSREKAHDNKEFGRENSTPCHESQTTIPEKVSNSEAAPNGAKLAMGQRKSRHKKTNFLRVDDFLNI